MHYESARSAYKMQANECKKNGARKHRRVYTSIEADQKLHADPSINF